MTRATRGEVAAEGRGRGRGRGWRSCPHAADESVRSASVTQTQRLDAHPELSLYVSGQTVWKRREYVLPIVQTRLLLIKRIKGNTLKPSDSFRWYFFWLRHYYTPPHTKKQKTGSRNLGREALRRLSGKSLSVCLSVCLFADKNAASDLKVETLRTLDAVRYRRPDFLTRPVAA